MNSSLHLLLRSEVAYIGALGSRKTHAKRRARLREAGFDNDAIDRVRGPAGLPIGACLSTVLGGPFWEIIVVTGHDRKLVEAAVGRSTVRCIHNPHYATGIASSLRAGVRAIDRESSGFAILLGDMPKVRQGTIENLCASSSANLTIPAFCSTLIDQWIYEFESIPGC